MNDDLISRRALIDAMYHEAFEVDSDLQKWDSGCWIRYKLFENVIESLPSAQPVIRCKDCRYSYECSGGRVCSHGVCVDCIVTDDFYCADAKR